jgi:hypothetical protein
LQQADPEAHDTSIFGQHFFPCGDGIFFPLWSARAAYWWQERFAGAKDRAGNAC